MSSRLGDEDLLAAVHANQGSMLLAEMLVFVMLGAMVGTAVLLSPILGRHSETLALGYVLARTLEVVTIAVGVVASDGIPRGLRSPGLSSAPGPISAWMR